MKRFNWQILLGLFFIALSVFFYLIHYSIFKDARHIFIYLLGDVAFVPIEVLFVTLIIHRLLSNREKRSLLKKMNMVIGAFFSEVGAKLLKHFSNFYPDMDKIRKDLIITDGWSAKELSALRKRLKNYDYKIDSRRGDMEDLRSFLREILDFMLRLLENPNLLEHDSFSELLWAVTHLTEELNHRKNVRQLSDADYEHLSGDMNRAYSLLVYEWLAYMKHLSDDYPYLFSLAIRTNPFDPDASPEFK